MARSEAIPFKGTRDIYGDDMRFRFGVLETIRKTYELFGFEPLETPVLERKATLYGKYGEEAENLLFTLDKPHEDGGLRYDHTVPLARFAAAHWQDLPKPYKRYAIGPVFRAENPQQGRYRQFYQCDFDTLGSDSPTTDAEIVAINHTVLSRLGFTDQYVVLLNDRKLLNAMVDEMGLGHIRALILRAWDKLDKSEPERVFEYLIKEAEAVGTKSEALREKYIPATEEILANRTAGYHKMMQVMRERFRSTAVSEALESMEGLVAQIRDLGVPEARFRFDPLLARGLGYYTGPIFETVVEKSGIGSISGGGRYDNLIEMMGGPAVSASGSSFGLDRLIGVMEQLGLRPLTSQTTQVFVTVFDQNNPELTKESLSVASKLRSEGINVETYAGAEAKIGKQIGIASKKQIPLCVVIGPEEQTKGQVSLKDMRTGKTEAVDQEKLVGKAKEWLE